MSPRALVPLLLLLPGMSYAGYTARFGATEVAVEPVRTGGSAAAYYGYDTTNPEASDTVDSVEADNTGVFMLHEDAAGQISLIVLLDKYGSSDAGKVNLVFSGATGSTWTVIDDPRSVDVRDVAGRISDGWDVKWTWGAGDADGGVLTLAPGDFCVGIDVFRTSGLSSYEVVTPDGAGGFTRTAIPSSDWRDIELCSVPDTDGDGIPDADDDCPATPSGVTVDSAGCPIDTDGDGVADYLDDCPGTAAGVEVDTVGCPVDSDGDGVDDEDDLCPGTESGVEVDADGCALDSDEDGVDDEDDLCPGTAAGVEVDADGCPVDTDGDGISDDLDDCPDTAWGDTVDDTGCSVADYCPCDDPWSWRGEYLICVWDEGKAFVDDGLMSKSEFKGVLWEAFLSDCGKSERSCRSGGRRH